MDKLVKHISALESAIPTHDQLNNSVSLASVGWHIEHSLKAIMLITAAVKRSDPKTYKRKFNFWKAIVYTTNRIPRGRAKAPKAVQPAGEINADKLQKMITDTLIVIKDLPALKKDNYFEHPYFGNLNLRATIKFLNIHTKHHLKIIKDIIARR